MKKLSLASLLALTACVGTPENVEPVSNFELEKYLGTWYEIARLDHSFERGMDEVTATYSLRKGGGVTVVNRGFVSKKDKWKEATGKAFFVTEPDTGHLKVSFFGPFYGAYIIFELDHDDYQYSLVAGSNKNYLWLMSRNADLDEATKQALIEKAGALGFDTDALIFPTHTSAKSGP